MSQYTVYDFCLVSGRFWVHIWVRRLAILTHFIIFLSTSRLRYYILFKLIAILRYITCEMIASVTE